MRNYLTILLATFTLAAFSQKKAGDYIESVNNNIDQSRSPRSLQYVPKDGAFFCVNGENRFTRALYGSNTDYRIETSDRPVFAIYKSKNYRSLRFYVEAGVEEAAKNGHITLPIQLDETEYCEASYKDGLRTYLLRDKRWGKDAVLYVDVVALPESEGAVWKFRAEGFNSSVRISYRMCDIANKKLHRNGDMGADKPGCFEPSPNEENLVKGEIILSNTPPAAVEKTTAKSRNSRKGSKTSKSKAVVEASVATPASDALTAYATLDFMTISLVPASGYEKNEQAQASKSAQQLFEGARAHFQALCSRLSFNTPDPWLNTLGGALVLAADGVWDGQTWLHGAIGWRMPLAGWRAGYLGDVLGWNDRAVSHFDSYAASQVTDQPVIYPGARQDTALCMARAEKKWGTEMYSTGYICRNPNRNNQMHHYDMNLNYMDELLWHFQYDADTAYMKKMWPVIERHLAWEKLNFDSDNDHLYDAYCCIWASDALYYSDGAVTHSSAYNYRGNLLAAKIARIIGKDPKPYQDEADAIRKAMNERLWVSGDAAYIPTPLDINENIRTAVPAHWAEYQESLGSKRLHPDAALWSVYTPIDCGVGTPEQMYSATQYVSEHIPHIQVLSPDLDEGYELISTSDWMPYAWSINNVASAEIMHTALSYFEAGNAKDGYNLLKSNVMDQMYLGQSPANFGQINYYDAARGECYRDFGDNVGISSRAIVQGLFGIIPQSLDGTCLIRPGFPLQWDSVEVHTPYLSYKYKKVTPTKAVLHVEQHFAHPLCVTVRINGERGDYTDYSGDASTQQDIEVTIPSVATPLAETVEQPQRNFMGATDDPYGAHPSILLGLENGSFAPFRELKCQDLTKSYNASVTDIFNNKYVSPRPTSTTLQMPTQGVGEWCHPQFKPEINDSAFRASVVNGMTEVSGIPFRTVSEGRNIVFASLWDNYPSSVTIPVKSRHSAGAYLLMAGSTNHMQTHLDNALVIANYSDGTSDTLRLIPPFNWCPIEQDYYVDGMAFQTMKQRPVRVSLGTNQVFTDGAKIGISRTEVYGREIPGGAAQMLHMLLDHRKKLRSFTVNVLAPDIVVGVMGITLE